MGHEFFLYADLIKIRPLIHIYLINNMFHMDNSVLSFCICHELHQTTPSRSEDSRLGFWRPICSTVEYCLPLGTSLNSPQPTLT